MMNLRFIKNVSAYSRPIDNLSFYSFQLSSLITKKATLYCPLSSGIYWYITSMANNDTRLFQR
jgi:hypothetical protein